jgi:hypothetical protein
MDSDCKHIAICKKDFRDWFKVGHACTYKMVGKENFIELYILYLPYSYGQFMLNKEKFDLHFRKFA